MLYRYRSLKSFDREIDALRNGYLYASSFDTMNDPMEAFYELGGEEDSIVNILFPSTPSLSNTLYSLYKNMIENFGLLSFAKSNMKYAMWAYYANNFSGICLEFDESILMKASLNGEKIQPIVYSNKPLPPISMSELLPPSQEQTMNTIVSRLIRKRKDWQHEDEVRIVTGGTGKKYFLDDALQKIFLGPKIHETHRELICSIFQNRPTEILMGKIYGYDLKFETIQPAKKLHESEKIGQNDFIMGDILYCSEQEIASFIDVPYSSFELLCAQLTTHPNMEKLWLINIEDNMLHFYVQYKVRGVPHLTLHLYYDKKLKLVKER